jgi:hypothetical protein
VAGTLDWNAAAAIASAVSALAAAISAFLSFGSLRRMSTVAREQRASHAVFQLIDISLKNKTLSTTRKGEDYEWYVVAVLELVREILIAYPNDLQRRNQMKLQLSFHVDQLRSWKRDCPEDIQDYGPVVERLVEEVLSMSQK